MSQPHTLASMRAAATKIGVLQRQIADLNEDRKTDPRKAVGRGKAYAEWLEILADYAAEKSELLAELQDLQDELAEAKQYLPTQPVPMHSLQAIIENLILVEAAFKVRGPDEGWDNLTAFIDALERDEARVESLQPA